MKILYHGSNQNILEIDIEKCKKGKDFGQGFYLTENLEKAWRMAKRTTRIYGGTAVVNAYEFNDISGLSVKVFDDTSAEWAEFIYRNREVEGFTHNYDLVIGPVADDNIRLQFQRMVRDKLSFRQIASSLEYSENDIQYCFCSLESLKKLKRHEIGSKTNN